MQLNRCFYQSCNPWETGHVRNILEIDSCTWFGCRFTCRDAQKQGAAKRRGCMRKKLILSIDDTWNNNDLRGWLVRTRQDIFFPTRSHSHQSGFFMLYRGKVVHDLNFFFLLSSSSSSSSRPQHGRLLYNNVSNQAVMARDNAPFINVNVPSDCGNRRSSETKFTRHLMISVYCSGCFVFFNLLSKSS
jgi:hypothetical protein